MRMAGFSWKITISELISGLIFLAMGAYIIYLAFVDKLFMRSDYQLEMNIYNAKFLRLINGSVTRVPEYLWALVFMGVVVFISYVSIKQYKKQKYEKK